MSSSEYATIKPVLARVNKGQRQGGDPSPKLPFLKRSLQFLWGIYVYVPTIIMAQRAEMVEVRDFLAMSKLNGSSMTPRFWKRPPEFSSILSQGQHRAGPASQTISGAVSIYCIICIYSIYIFIYVCVCVYIYIYTYMLSSQSDPQKIGSGSSLKQPETW